MTQWVTKGLATGIRTTAYPQAEERAAGVTPGLPDGGTFGAEAEAIAARCPSGALTASDGRITVDEGRCIHSLRCVRGLARPLGWKPGYEWAKGRGEPLGRAFERSIHVLVVDAGDCGACLNEVKQLDNPYYNMHRLGFFITPTPRHADVLLVVGVVTDQMQDALRKIYDAMPTPKRVVAVGACALSGGAFQGSFACVGPVSKVIPVDVEVPGNPPPPLAIIHALLLATGRR